MSALVNGTVPALILGRAVDALASVLAPWRPEGASGLRPKSGGVEAGAVPLFAALLSPEDPGSGSEAVGSPGAEPCRLPGVVESGGSPVASAGNAVVSGGDAGGANGGEPEGGGVGIAVEPPSGDAPLGARATAMAIAGAVAMVVGSMAAPCCPAAGAATARASTVSSAALSDLRVGTGDIGSPGTTLVVVGGWPVVAASVPTWSVAVRSADIEGSRLPARRPQRRGQGSRGHWPRSLILAHGLQSMSARSGQSPEIRTIEPTWRRYGARVRRRFAARPRMGSRPPTEGLRVGGPQCGRGPMWAARGWNQSGRLAPKTSRTDWAATFRANPAPLRPGAEPAQSQGVKGQHWGPVGRPCLRPGRNCRGGPRARWQPGPSAALR